MARLARLVVPGMPHHVTERGNRRQQTFFNEGDYAAYLELTAQWCSERGVEIWSYCLMANHVHLIAVPSSKDALRWAIGSAHERSTRRINFRQEWRGYLWQGRFSSFVMDEPYLLAAARYVELHPVWAGLVTSPGDGNALLGSAVPEEQLKELRRHARTGRPLGNESFLERLEAMVGRVLKPPKRGPKPKQRAN